jgi:hypothetical protein
MINDVNKAVIENKSVCLGQMKNNRNNGYNALIYENYDDINSR